MAARKRVSRVRTDRKIVAGAGLGGKGVRRVALAVERSVVGHERRRLHCSAFDNAMDTLREQPFSVWLNGWFRRVGLREEWREKAA
ncbi:hypothetical protein PSAB6_490025 [Paraburkholderia sabiae]|nr:hypothetical protein PSAB6_490025 [Paraburkholderia sabiae]